MHFATPLSFEFLDAPGCQEPCLVWPEAFMNILLEVPTVPRPFKMMDQERKLKLLALADTLLETVQDESTQRTVQYLLKLCTPCEPDPLPTLNWVSERVPNEFDPLENLRCRPAERLIPQMRFVARLARRR